MSRFSSVINMEVDPKFSLIGHETFIARLNTGATVVSCHHSNDATKTKAQWDAFSQWLESNRTRVYKVGDSNYKIRPKSNTEVDLLDKETDKLVWTINLGRKYLIKKNTINTTVKVRFFTTQPKDGILSACDIDEVLVILGDDEQDADISMEDWVEEYGVIITDPNQAIGASFPTDHRTACARVNGITIKTKNVCGESDADPSNDISEPIGASVCTESNSWAKADTNILEFMSAGSFERFKIIKPIFEALKDQVSEDLGPIEKDGKLWTFRQLHKAKEISGKDALRTATWVNIHNMLPRGYHPFMDHLHDKFEQSYDAWMSSPKTTEYAKQIAHYWIYFKALVEDRLKEFIKTAFDELITIKKITMEEDLELEMQGQLADVICLQEVSLARHQRLTCPKFVSKLEVYGYVLQIPPYESVVKTCGAIIIRANLIDKVY